MELSRLHRIKRKLYLLVTVIAFLGVCAALYYKTTRLQKEEAQVEVQIDKANDKYTSEKEREEEIKERKAYVQTKRFAEDVAREKFGMVYKDEVIFKPEEN